MSRIIRVVVATVAGVAVLGSPPWDLAAKTPKAKAEENVKEMKFDEADVVEAQFLRPDQSVAEALVRRKGSSLIQVRTDFVDEILKSAEDL